MESLVAELQVDVLGRADSRALADANPMLGTGSVSEQQFAELVKRGFFLTDDVSADDLFTWTIQAINSKTFSHSMWMDQTSLQNFVGQSNGPHGIPYLRNHDTGQGTTGRVFYGSLVDDGPEPQAKPAAGAIPTFRDLFREQGNVLRVFEQAYMARGLVLEGLSTDDYIRQLELGIQASNSIGWAIYGPLEPGSYIECDHCKVDLLRADYDECDHFPGAEYAIGIGEGEDRETITALATARIVNGRQRELSGVYLGAVPDTFTERGKQLHAAGHLSLRQARHLEDQLQLTRGRIVGDEQHISIPTPARANDQPAEATPTRGQQPDGGNTVDPKQLLARIRELLAKDTDLLAGLDAHAPDKDPIAALIGLMREEGRNAAQALSASEDKYQAMQKRIAKRLGAGEDETLDAALTRIEGTVKIGGQVRTRLLKDLSKEMTRAGMPTQPEEVEKMALAWDLDQIEAQIKRHKALADRKLPPGSVGQSDLSDRHEGDDDTPLKPAWESNGKTNG